MFAGSWYPDTANECERQINTFLKEGQTYEPLPEKNWVGGIVPHAGWYFSGSIACNVIHNLSKGKRPDVIAIFGMHLHPNSNRYLMKSDAINTPFGPLSIAEELAHRLSLSYKFNLETVKRFTPDNTIELQLPFIKYFFPEVQILPMGVPPHLDSLKIGKSAVNIADELGLNLMVIGSTDLTHYGTNYGFVHKGKGREALKWVMEENDRKVIEHMLNFDGKGVIKEGLSHQNACCSGAVAAAIAAAEALGADTATKLAYATSYDKSPQDNFVGYVGIVLGMQK
jgi:AmmeMemoRadiSam system protein B